MAELYKFTFPFFYKETFLTNWDLHFNDTILKYFVLVLFLLKFIAMHISCTLHYFVPVQTCFTFQGGSAKTETGGNLLAWKGLGQGLLEGERPQGLCGLDGNKLAQLWDIAHHFYLPCLRCIMNSTIDRTFQSCFTKEHIS